MIILSTWRNSYSQIKIFKDFVSTQEKLEFNIKYLLQYGVWTYENKVSSVVKNLLTKEITYCPTTRPSIFSVFWWAKDEMYICFQKACGHGSYKQTKCYASKYPGVPLKIATREFDWPWVACSQKSTPRSWFWSRANETLNHTPYYSIHLSLVVRILSET